MHSTRRASPTCWCAAFTFAIPASLSARLPHRPPAALHAAARSHPAAQRNAPPRPQLSTSPDGTTRVWDALHSSATEEALVINHAVDPASGLPHAVRAAHGHSRL